MKTKLTLIQWAALLALLSTLNLQLPTVFAQGTAFTYQGRVLDNGTNFTGAGQFKFALVTSTNGASTATATANAPSGGYITGYAVTYGGNGYVTAPIATVSGGGGSGAAAHANLTSGAVTSLAVDNPGNGGYTSTPMVLIAPPPPNISYTTYWSNDGTSVAGSEPSGAVNVAVSSGLFTVVLGDTTQPNMTTLSASLFAQPNLQLRIWFNDGIHGSTALDPAQNLTPAPYAINANTAINLVNGLTVQQNTNGAPNVIGGSSSNFVFSGVLGATIGGGGATNDSNGIDDANIVTTNFGTVSGGEHNTASGVLATVGGGYGNSASGGEATVGGGDGNTASGVLATVSGGTGSTASGQYATVSGGHVNTASGDYSFVGGGILNTAGGSESFAAGASAFATHANSFVWSDGNHGGGFSSTAANQFSVCAAGGIVLAGDVQIEGGAFAYHHLELNGGNATGYLYGSYPGLSDGIHLGYNYYYDNVGTGHASNSGGGTSRISAGYGFVGIYVGGAGAAPTTQRLYADTTHIEVDGTFNNNSDRNAKQDFVPVSSSQILDEVLQLPISKWSYKDDPTTRHVGPVAQDFYGTFKIGTDDRHIAPIDEGGLAFAAIQGLNQKLEEKNSEIQNLVHQNDSLEKRLNELEKAVARVTEKSHSVRPQFQNNWK